MNIELRRARPSDREKVLEISSHTWEGNDYVPDVFEDWLRDPRGEFVVAVVDGVLAGLARRTYLLPGYTWFEGIRTHPDYRNCGVARRITGHFLEGVRRDKALRIGLSTHIENEASVHIIEQNGFARVASFAYMETCTKRELCMDRECSDRAVEVSPDDAIPFIRDSRFLRVARGHLPRGWKFYPFGDAPEVALSRMHRMIGIIERGRLSALLCLGLMPGSKEGMTIDFAEGGPHETVELLMHALFLSGDQSILETMIPKWDKDEAPALAIMKKVGFCSWNDYKEDVFVYEREP